MQNSIDSYEVEEGIRKFIEWLQSGKLEIRVFLLKGYMQNSIS